ncbi:hypothetical protein [Pseudoalteromonas piscicida]|uniref:hypothetical protein n=1 Tax=Pseudoalteromonas piscicida TaxID=43662 RepID=UPI000E35AED3|nr:hypothetical protein [Pseudoalteromonas piscicida]AXQ97562.1 hypothetical protein D0N37_07220 [Pseudoalteromonas piscicida]
MDRARKVPLSDILPVREIAIRDPFDSGSKAKAHALESLTKEHRKAIASGSKQGLIDTPKGKSISSAIEPLLVAKPPKDLPEYYKDNLKKSTFVLVDGYQRYAAIKSAHGLNVRVSIKEVKGDSLTELMRLALDANYRHPMILDAEQKRTNVFRLLLLGVHTQGVDSLMRIYGDSFSRSTLSEYIALAKYAREEANLKELAPEDVSTALRQTINDNIGDFVTVRCDAKGFPLKSTVKVWRHIRETGDIDAFFERYKKEQERTESETKELARELSYVLKGTDPKILTKVLPMFLQKAREESEVAPDLEFED